MRSEYLRHSMSQTYIHIRLRKQKLKVMNNQNSSGRSRCRLQKMPQMERILDKRVSKKTRRKQYFEYLVKWKNHPVEDASWETEAEIQKHGQTMQELMDRSP
jgi:hypothetical protein